MFGFLANVLLICAAVLTLAWLVAAQHRLVVRATRRFVALPRVEQALLVVAVGVMTVCAQKQRTNENAIVELSNNRIIESAEASASNVLPAALNTEGTEVGRHGEEVVSTVQGGSGVSPLQNEEVGLLNRSGETPLPLLETVSASPRLSNLRVTKTIDTNDIVRGFALVEVRTNATVSYAMPTNGVEVGTWGKTGAYEDVVRVKLAAKKAGAAVAFPFGDVCVTSLWAHTWGKVRPRIRDRAHEIVVVGTPMSVVAGEGRLWTAATTNGTWLLTWEKFVAGRRSAVQGGSGVSPLHDEEVNIHLRSISPERSEHCEAMSLEGCETPLPPSSETSANSEASVLRAKNSDLISAQIEFFANGDFIARSNEIERVYRRVNPDDWDDDGIANEIDDDPLVSADETQFGPNQTLPDGANTNAYCWVDFVVPQSNTKVMFVGDGASNLTDPSFIAKAGETNRVTLLIGKSYHATCPLPFRIAAKSSEEIEEDWLDERTLELCWPVRISSAGQSASTAANEVVSANDEATANASVSAISSTASFAMAVEPVSLGGVFTWTNACCSISGGASSFAYSCRSGCSCAGCSASGYYAYEGYRIGCVGGTCPCTASPDGESDEDDDPQIAGVAAGFSKRVIFFEDEYDNSPTEHVGWRSAETVLNCTASGGEKGGFVRFEIEGEDNLVQYNGKPLPYMQSLASGETISFQNTYRAVKESDAVDDIKVTATLVESDAGATQSAEATATAVRVEIEPVVSRDDASNRHLMGIGEIFHVWTFPDLNGVELRMSEGWERPLNGDEKSVACPLNAARNGVRIVVEGIAYVPSLDVIVPSSIVCRGGMVIDQGLGAGVAGGIGMLLEPYVQPGEVAFSRVKMMEIPTLVGAVPATGYFANERYAEVWAHTQANGAGVWHRPGTDNFFFRDLAAFGEECPQPWSVGRIAWNIPIGWSDIEAESSAEILQEISAPYSQVFTIDSDGGVKVEKFGRWVKRMPTGEITCSDGIVNLQEE